MRLSTIIIVASAAICAVLAALLARVWLQNQKSQPVVVKTEAVRNLKMASVVVARKSLKFGNQLSAKNITTIPWPKKSVPKGAFTNIKKLLKSGKRQVLVAVAVNEPILRSKITKPGQKASLSTVISEDKRAVTIRVNDVLGVGGLINPQDYVDIALTRGANSSVEGGKRQKAFTDILLQNVKVLAIDQSADLNKSKKPAKTVTLEVNTIQAQKLALATSVGTLSLMLRGVGANDEAITRRIDIDDLLKRDGNKLTNTESPSVTIYRSGSRKEYNVPSDVRRFQSVEQEPQDNGFVDSLNRIISE